MRVLVAVVALAACSATAPPPPPITGTGSAAVVDPPPRPPHDVAIPGIEIQTIEMSGSAGRTHKSTFDSIWILVEVTDTSPHTIVIERLGMSRRPIAITGVVARAPNVGPLSRGDTSVSLPAAGKYSVEIRFAQIELWGGRYTYEIDAAIDGVRTAIDVGLTVKTLEPYRTEPAPTR